MINNLLVLGNGFDLHCGLASSFSQYYENRCLAKVKKLYDLFDIADYEETREYYTQHEDVINFWSFLFYVNYYVGGQYKITYNKKKNWFDIEELIRLALTKEIRNHEKLEVFVKEAFRALSRSGSFRSDQNRIIRENPFAFFPYCQKTNETDPYDYLLKELRRFESSFKEYMMDIVRTGNYMNNRAHFLRELQKETESRGSFHLINFNYTSFDRLDDTTTYANSQVNVHGTIKGDSIIIGIDSGSANSADLIRFTKTFRNIHRLKKTFELPDKVESISFYGHSLAEADFSYFHSLFDMYHLYDGSLKLTFFYSDYGENEEKNEANHAAYVKRVYELIGKYSQQARKDSNLLHRLLLEGRIVIQKI